jgi:hypothetical protein
MAKEIIQQALGLNPVPVLVTVTIDGNQVFSGAVPTLDMPGPVPDPSQGQDAWSWGVPGQYWGTQTMVVTVHNGLMLLGYTFMNLSAQDPSRKKLRPRTQGDGFDYYDPFSNITINGIAQNPARSAQLNGQWTWALSESDVFSCAINIQPPEPLPT